MTDLFRRGSWLITVPLAAATVAYVMLFFLPNHRAIGELRQEIRAKQDYLTEAIGNRSKLTARKAELDKATAYSVACRRRTPDEQDLSAFFGKIHNAANAAGIRITRFDPQPAIPYERFRRVPVMMSCHGSFAHMCAFLKQLEETQALMWIEGLKLENVGEDGKDVGCEIILAVFAGNPEISDYAKH